MFRAGCRGSGRGRASKVVCSKQGAAQPPREADFASLRSAKRLTRGVGPACRLRERARQARERALQAEHDPGIIEADASGRVHDDGGFA